MKESPELEPPPEEGGKVFCSKSFIEFMSFCLAGDSANEHSVISVWCAVFRRAIRA
jgi:hypothetical protein